MPRLSNRTRFAKRVTSLHPWPTAEVINRTGAGSILSGLGLILPFYGKLVESGRNAHLQS